jgi:cell wall-associated NlpC family hydrolase
MNELQQRSAVVAEALTWLETPYHHHGRIKAVGVDCAQILCAVYEACELVGHIELGNYPPQWHLHHSEELYLGWLEKVGAREVQAPALGDIAVYKFGRCYSHGAIVVGPELVVHSYLRRGVHLSRFTEAPLAGRPVKFFSIWAGA